MKFLFFCFVLLLSKSALAETIKRLDSIRIIGTDFEQELTKPSSVHVIRESQLNQQQQSDVTRVLKQVPGVYVQEEEGLGLRPNIGLRGTHPHRSRKVVLLEDGLLIGPAPYSAPAAYYTPSMFKIEGMEVFKGVSAVSYGPNSIGGAINYITRSLRDQNQVELELTGGSFDYQKSRGMMERKLKNGGVLADMALVNSESFKRIEGVSIKGVQKNDILFKGRHFLDEGQSSYLGWKLSHATEISGETYLGLSLEDFEASPYSRYVASEKDQMKWAHSQVQLLMGVENSAVLSSQIQFYHHQFKRNWSRLNNFTGNSPSLYEILKDPHTSINQAYFDVLLGKTNSAGLEDLIVTNNDRTFESQGIQAGSLLFWQLGELSNTLKGQMKIHKDFIQRNHSEDRFAMVEGRLARNESFLRVESANNRDQSVAKTLSIENEASGGAWKYTLTSRFEEVDYKTKDELLNGDENHSERVFVPGIGVFYQQSERFAYLFGLSKGYTLIGANRNESHTPEVAVNSEIGMRYKSIGDELFFELIHFRSDYKNIKGTCSFSSGCITGSLDSEYDGGQALINGFEGRTAYSYIHNSWTFPVGVNFTITKAVFTSYSESKNPEWGVGRIDPGDPLPYVPEKNYSVFFGTLYKKFAQEFTINWTGKMYDQSVATDRLEIPAHGVVDYTANLAVSNQIKIFSRVDNLLNSKYLVSLRPFGARPGKPQSMQIGLKANF